MKKRILSFVLVFLVISMSFGYSSDALFSKIDIPKVGVENNSISITRYVYGINGLVASIDKSGVEYYHSDRIFSNRLITDLFGEIIKQFKSLPFGQEIRNNGITFSFATGK